MRITVSHERTKEEVKRAVDKSFEDVFKGVTVLPVQLLQEQKGWRGDTFTFSLVAKMGLMSTPIHGTVEVTDRDVTINVDLGLLERLIPASKVKEVLQERVRGLLK